MKQTFTYILKDYQIKTLINYLNNYKIIDTNPYLIGRYYYLNSHISIYKSMKMVIQSSDIKAIINDLNQKLSWSITIDEPCTDTSSSCAQYDLIGCDEVGVGDFFGGIVCACVYLSQDDMQKVQQLPINDSKQMNDETILELYPTLIKEFKYSVASFSPQEYNNFYSQHPNTHLIKTFLHNKALTRLFKKYSLSHYHIVMDAYVSEPLYTKYLNDLQITNPIKIDYFIQKAESKFYAVAIASMIARATFLLQMQKINDKLNLQLPLGVNYTKIYDISSTIINQFGIDLFRKLVKQHFKTFSLVMQKYGNKK